MKKYWLVGLFAIISQSMVMSNILAADMGATLKDNTTNSGFTIKEKTTDSTVARFRGDGNVGIGTANPAAKLDIAGNIAINGAPVIDSTGKWVGDSIGLEGPPGPQGPPGPVAKYGGVAVVAKSGGDYTDPVAAMVDIAAWGGTPSPSNPCLLKIMPGVYDIGTNSLVMQPYVDIEGGGESVTKINGTISSVDYPISNGVVQGASNAEIRFLAVENTGTSSYKAALYNGSGAAPKVTHVTAISLDSGLYNCGIFNNNSAPYIAYVKVNASGATNNFGIYNHYSSPELFDVTVKVSGGTNSAMAIYNWYSPNMGITNSIIEAWGAPDNRGICDKHTSGSPTLIRNTRISASGGSNNYGIYTESSSLTMASVWINASGGTGLNIGISTFTSGVIRVDNSVVRGNSNTIANRSGVTTNLGSTKLEGGNWSNSGVIHTVGCYDENYDPIVNQ